MKIGLISDIHGEAEHLRAALAFLDRQQVTHILCAGDLVDGGGQGDAVVALIRDRQLPCVKGNHDADPESAASLQTETLMFLRELPVTLDFEFAGKRLRLRHATPWSYGVHLFSYSTRDFFRRMIEEPTRAEVIVSGHTHEPMRAVVDGCLLLNPGAVQQNRFQSNYTCAILSLPDFDYTVYDIHTELPLRIPNIHPA